jgi:hypothetical protein
MITYKGTRYWNTGFKNNFEVVASKQRLLAEIEFSKTLTSVERTVIKKGNKTIYDDTRGIGKEYDDGL